MRLPPPNLPRSLKSSSFWVIQSSISYISNILFSLHYSFLTKTLSIKNPQFLHTLSMASSRRPSKLTIKSKVREEQQPNEHDYTRLLRPEHIHRFEANFLPRQVMLPKFGVLSDFDDKGFMFPGILRGQGLERFISVRESIYPNLMKMFYTSLNFEKEKIRSSIKGIRFSLNHREFGDAFHVPHKGERLGGSLTGPWEDTKEEMFQSLCDMNWYRKMEARKEKKRKEQGQPKDSKFIMHAGWMTVENRLLHYFLAYVICPKTNNHAQLNSTELYLMKAMVDGLQVDWAYQIRQHMMSTYLVKTCKFPYGCHLTEIFRKQDISLDGEGKIEVDTRDWAIDSRSFGSMQIRLDPFDGMYKYNGEIGEHDDEDDDDDVPMRDVPIPPSGASSSSTSHDDSNAILLALNQMKLDMHNRFDTIQTTMTNTFNNRIDSLQVHFDNRFDEMQRNNNERFDAQQGSLTTMNDILADILKSME